MSKVYVLQKDYETPTMAICKGEERSIPEWCKIFPDMWGKDFATKKDWFLEKEEPEPTVVENWTANNEDIDFFITSHASTHFKQIKISRERLAEILIAESKGDLTIWRIKEDNICPATNEQCDDECCPPGAICNLKPSAWGRRTQDKSYTEKELLEAEMEAFKAARSRIGGFWNEVQNWVYRGFSDYKNQNK